MKKYKVAILAALALGMTAGNAMAATIDLYEWASNVDGVTTGAVSPTIGPMSLVITGAGSHYANFFLDYEIDQLENTYFNEYGSTVGTAAAGQSWEIDEPGAVFGDIYTNVVAGALDNTNSVPDTVPEDVSIAMGWDFSLLYWQTAYISMTISASAPTTGFYLVQTDPDTLDPTGQVVPTSIYFSSTIDIRGTDPNAGGGPAPVPEPATMLLMGTGLAGLYGARRKKAA